MANVWSCLLRIAHSVNTELRDFLRRLESSTKLFFYLQGPFLVIDKMSEREHSDSEFYYPDEQEIVTTGGGDDENENNNNQEEIEDFIKEQKSANTARKTTSDLKTLKRYLQSIDKGQIEMVNLPAPELDHLLAKFFKDVHTVNGDEYEPDSVSSVQRSIHRFLTDQKYPHNILKDREFGTSRSVLAAKRKQLIVKHGKGNRPNATRPITDGDEETFF